MQVTEDYAREMKHSHIKLSSCMHRAKLGFYDFYKSLNYVELNDIKKYSGKKLNNEKICNFMNKEFWKKIDEIVLSSKIIIDRPKGTAHPKYPKFIYPVDYGFLEGTKASDGAEIDIWLGTLPHKISRAILCTVNKSKRDIETKILIGCSNEEAKIILKTMNNNFMSAILVFRNKDNEL